MSEFIDRPAPGAEGRYMRGPQGLVSSLVNRRLVPERFGPKRKLVRCRLFISSLRAISLRSRCVTLRSMYLPTCGYRLVITDIAWHNKFALVETGSTVAQNVPGHLSGTFLQEAAS
jgi:hypothetical protein